ncbi:unnamed protein product, partial [Coregonus sp. 'balchen']
PSPSAVREREEGARVSFAPANSSSSDQSVLGVKSNESDPLTFYCVGQTARIGNGPNRYRTNAICLFYCPMMYCGFILFLSTQLIVVAPLIPNDTCGDNIEITNADYLTSTGYPTSYPPSQQCMWVISAPEPGQKILINFNPHFDLEDRDCKY